MRINANYYKHDDLILRYSRTAEAVKSFDSVLSEIADRFSRAKNISGYDTLLAQTAQNYYSRETNIFSRRDPVLGDTSCV